MFQYRPISSRDSKKSTLCLFLTLCCAFIFPNFSAFADTNSISIETPSRLSSNTKVYFYNPEINTARNLVLKSVWDKYLHEMGHYELQPVDSGQDFKRLVQQEQNAAFIMSEWLYSSLATTLSEAGKQKLELVYVGMKGGSDTYHKILVSNKNALDLEGITIASSGSQDRTSKILSSIYSEYTPEQLQKINILVVPKDIDALMAVGYGLAEMALTTEVSLSKMALLNEELYKDMIILRKSQPFKRSVLVFKSDNLALKTNLAAVLKNMEQHFDGLKALSLLGLDEWKLVDKTMANIQQGLIDARTTERGHAND